MDPSRVLRVVLERRNRVRDVRSLERRTSLVVVVHKVDNRDALNKVAALI